MLIELFILFQLITVGTFVFAYHNNQVILWLLTMVLSGMLMLSSYGIEKTVYVWNATTAFYDVSTVVYSYPALFGINFAILALSLLYFFQDMWEFNVLQIFKK